MATVAIALIGISTSAQTGPGDIAFTAYNGDADDNFAFVTLVDITHPQSIWFTDNEWTGSAFNNINEGEIEWSTTANVSAGTVIWIQGNSGGAPTTSLGSVSGSGLNLGASNETLYALLEQPATSMASATFLAGVSNDDDGSGGTLTGTGLTNGTNFVDFDNDHDGFEYQGPRTGESSFSDYLPLIANLANWQDETSAGANILPIDLTVFTIGGGVTEPTVQTNSFTLDACMSFVDISWTNGDGSNRVVKINTTNSFTAPVDGTTYTANATYGGGEQVVYNSNGNSVTVTGLTAGTTYYVTAYEYNGSAGSEDYLTTGATTGSTTTPSIPTTLPAVQDFDSGNDIPYCSSPGSYFSNGSGVDDDVWRVQAAVSSSGSGGTINALGTNMWAMQDIDNGNGGGNFEHYLDFGPVDISGYSSVQLSFQYNAYIEAGGGDFLAYQVEYNNGSTWTAGTTTIATSTSHTSGAWVTETVTVPGGSNYVRLRIIADFNSGADIVGIDSVMVEDVTISAPTAQATNISAASCQRPNSLNINWVDGNGTARIVVANTTNSFTTPVDGTTYTANANYSGGEQVVYNGTGNSVFVGNLASSTTYYFRVFEYNGSGGNEVYLTTTGTNNPNSFTTTPTPSTLPVGEDFDSNHTLPYCISPNSYNVSGDVWANVSTLTSITPTNGSGMWGARDIENSNGGGAFFHTMDFGPVDVSAYTNARIRFNYNVIGYDYPFDTIRYQVIYDDLNAEWNGTNVNLATSGGNSGGWVTETVNIPGGTNTVRLRIEMLQNGGSDYAAIDEVVIEEVPTGAEVNFASLSGMAMEDDGTYSVNLDVTNPSTTYATTVDVALTSGTAANINNYTTQTVIVPAGASSAAFTVTITDDLLLDGQESFSFELQNAMTGFVAATVGTSNTHDLTVDDNEVPALVINEIQYNSNDGAGFPDTDYEFIEIYNNQGATVDISGYFFTQGVTYTFPTSTTIDAGEYIIVAYNPATYTGNGYDVYGPWTGGLSNGGEDIELVTSGGLVVDYVDYDDGSGWPGDPDGDGPTLSLRHYLSDNEDEPGHWKKSCAENGTPGAENDAATYWAQQDGNWSDHTTWGWHIAGTNQTTPLSPGFTLDDCDDVLIPYNGMTVTVDVNGSIDNVEIEPGASFIMNSGVTLTVNGDIEHDGKPAGFGEGTLAFTSGNHNLEIDPFPAGTVTLQGMDIPSGASVTATGSSPLGISEGLVLDGTLDVTGIDLTILSDASGTGWIDDWDAGTGATTGTLTGNVTLQRYIPSQGYQYIGTPLINADSEVSTQLSELNPNGPDGAQLVPSQIALNDPADCSPDFISGTSPWGTPVQWDEGNAGTVVSGCTVEGWSINSAGNLEPARGYGFYGLIPPTVAKMTGTPNTGDVTYGPLSNSGGSGNGYQLVSNPYPSAMQWEGMSGYDAAAYFWVSSGLYSGTYVAQFQTTPGALVGMYQGFFVRVSSGSAPFTTTNTMRRAESGNFYREARNTLGDQMLSLDVVGNGFGHKTIIYFGANDHVADSPEPTKGWDGMCDAGLMIGHRNQPHLYTRLTEADDLLSDHSRLSINGLPTLSEPYTVPVGFHAGTSGQYTITAKHLETFLPGTEIVLEDIKLGTTQSLTASDVYAFRAEAHEDPERFLLHFNPASTTSGSSEVQPSFFANEENITMRLNTKEEVVGQITVWNSLGQEVLPVEQVTMNNGRYEINASTLNAGIYVVRFTTTGGVYSDHIYKP